ncbi:MAG: single-stranded DNA-binding protein [Mycobacterium sp.]
MANDTIITVIGNLTNDPELRFTPSGSAVANFTIASTPRTFDKQSNEWKDGETLFVRSSIWREAAENTAESLTKGMRVIAQGRLKSRSYDKDGEKRTVIEFEVDEIGPSLQYASAKVTRKAKGQGQQQTQQPAQQQPWGGNQPAQNPGGWGNGNQAEAPF